MQTSYPEIRAYETMRHPSSLLRRVGLVTDLYLQQRAYRNMFLLNFKHGVVSSVGRTSDCGSECQGFEFLTTPHLEIPGTRALTRHRPHFYATLAQ